MIKDGQRENHLERMDADRFGRRFRNIFPPFCSSSAQRLPSLQAPWFEVCLFARPLVTYSHRRIKVLDPTDCRKRLVSGNRARRIKTERMIKSVKRLRKNQSVLGVRNRILSGVASQRVASHRENGEGIPGQNQKGQHKIKGEWDDVSHRYTERNNRRDFISSIFRHTSFLLIKYIYYCTFEKNM